MPPSDSDVLGPTVVEQLGPKTDGLSPGLVGIALALTIERSFPGSSSGGLLLTAVVIGSVVSDLLSLAVKPEEQA